MCRFTVLLLAALIPGLSFAQDDSNKTIRVGVIGLDTSHVVAFTKSFNAQAPRPELMNCRVVAAYPKGSLDIESSYSRIPKYTEAIKEMGVEISESVDALLEQVDCVLLETNDGKRHLEQALKVFATGKPVFIDKPVGANLGQVVAIYRAARISKTPMFSSSSLRYGTAVQAIRAGKCGDVIGCSAYSPCALEPSHSRLYWYGIHGVESLFTCMGAGCESVSMTTSDDADVAVGRWNDGRIGTFRGIREGKTGYGGIAFGSKSVLDIGKGNGYEPLLIEIAKFFRTRESPIDDVETINLYAFMSAAQASAEKGGEPVQIASVMQAAEREADKLLSNWNVKASN